MNESNGPSRERKPLTPQIRQRSVTPAVAETLTADVEDGAVDCRLETETASLIYNYACKIHSASSLTFKLFLVEPDSNQLHVYVFGFGSRLLLGQHAQSVTQSLHKGLQVSLN